MLVARIQDHSLPVGSRLPSTTELAQAWNVAHATAHAALNDLTRDGWLVRSPRHGTFVAQPAARPVATRTAVIAFPPNEDIAASGNGNEVFAMLQGVMEEARSLGWQVRLEPLPRSPQGEHLAAAEAAIREGSGAIFLGYEFLPLIQRLHDDGFPLVILNDDPGFAPLIHYDRARSIADAVGYLAAQGAREVGYVGPRLRSQEKFPLFLKACAHHGFSVREENLFIVEPGEGADGAIAAWFEQPQPRCDALFLINYQLAVSFARQAMLRGVRLPQEVRIIAQGVRSLDASDLFPYMKIPYFEYGVEAIRFLEASVGQPRPTQRKIITLNATLQLP